MKEDELVQLQIEQLKKELKFYYDECKALKDKYSELKVSGIGELKSKLRERFNFLLFSDGITITGGFEDGENSRVNACFHNLTYDDTTLTLFSISINKKGSELEIELQEPPENKSFPFSCFIKTGRNKLRDYSILSTTSEQGLGVISQLNDRDLFIIIGLIEEFRVQLIKGKVKILDLNNSIIIDSWPNRLLLLKQQYEKILVEKNSSLLGK